MVSWASLSADLVRAIGKRIDEYKDYVRFRAVCVPWRSALPARPHHGQLNRIPWLIQPFDDKTKSYSGFYGFCDKKIHHLDLTEVEHMVCRGSFDGWLVMVDLQGGQGLYLHNPLTKTQVALPPRSTMPDVINYDDNRHDQEYLLRDSKTSTREFYLNKAHVQKHLTHKIVLSSSPSSRNNNDDDDYVAMAIYGGFCTLAFCKRNDKTWTAAPPPGDEVFEDVLFHDGKFYALSIRHYFYNRLWVCDVGSPAKMTVMDTRRMSNSLPGTRYYLAAGSSSTHGLMIVERLYEYNDDKPFYWTTMFKFYKLMIKNTGSSNCRRYEWVRVANLGGDYMLFLGFNSSLLISLSPITNPDLQHLKGNHVYFTDDYSMYHFRDGKDRYGGYDFGMCNLDTNTVYPLPGSGNKSLKRLDLHQHYKSLQRQLDLHQYKIQNSLFVNPCLINHMAIKHRNGSLRPGGCSKNMTLWIGRNCIFGQLLFGCYQILTKTN